MSFESAHTAQTEACNEKARAELREIVTISDHNAMLEALRAHPCYESVREEWLAAQMPDSARTYAETLNMLPLTASDKDTALALWLHHEVTGAHSVKTASLLELVLEHSPLLRTKLEEEGISATFLVRAGILHDAGKLDIEREILSATPTDEECWGIFAELCAEEDSETLEILTRRNIQPDENQTLVEAARATGIRPIRLLPGRAVVGADVLAMYEAEHGAAYGKTLLDIIIAHEQYTRIRLADDPIMADIAGHHHTPEESAHPFAASTIGTTSRISAELLHLVDIIEAVTATRDYHEGRPLVDALILEIHEARSNKLREDILTEVIRVFEATDGLRLASECERNPERCAELNTYCRIHNLPPIMR